MILISNNLNEKMELPEDSVIRINMAWIKSKKNLEKIFNKIELSNDFNYENDGSEPRKVFLDYPLNRKKIPTPILTIEDAYWFCKRYADLVDYFAVSNIEKIDTIKLIQNEIPQFTQFVPKIETSLGVLNLSKMIKACRIQTIMLDKEDLLTDLKGDNKLFFRAIDRVRKVCKSRKVTLLELQGVVFIG